MLHLPKKMRYLPYVLIAPAFILLCIFKLYPIVLTMMESFIVDSEFTLDVYVDLFKDSTFWNALWVTIKMNLVMIPVQVVLAFAFALLVNVQLKGISIFRTIFYLPVTISLSIACLVWNIMLNPNSGVINSILNIFGIPAQDFFLNKTQALWCIVVVATWKGVGYWMMFLLAGLKNIDPVIYEAAKIDGSNWVTTLFKITVPLVKRVLLFVFVANTTANILMFVPMQVITGGGPQETTNTLMYEAYKSAFKFGDRPRSSAMVMILLILILGICIVQASLLNDKGETKTKRRKKA